MTMKVMRRNFQRTRSLDGLDDIDEMDDDCTDGDGEGEVVNGVVSAISWDDEAKGLNVGVGLVMFTLLLEGECVVVYAGSSIT